MQEVLSVHKAQRLSYMKLLDIPLGLLIDFHELKLADGLCAGNLAFRLARRETCLIFGSQ